MPDFVIRRELKISIGLICAGGLIVIVASTYIVEQFYGVAYGLLVGELGLTTMILARGIYEAVVQHRPSLLYVGLLLLVLGAWALGLMLSNDPHMFGAFLALGAGIGWIIFGIVMWARGH